MALSKNSKWGIAAAVAATAGGLFIAGPAMGATSTPTSTSTSTSGHGDGGRGGSADTPVTSTEATKATDAVTAKDSSVTVTGVRKDPDGSYDVLGTKAGAQVMYDVSADLKTVTLNAGGHGGGHGSTAESSTGA